MMRGVNKTWIKICGTTSLNDAQLSVKAGADGLGFIFTTSPRQIDVAAAAEIVSILPSGIETVGVFVNESPVRVAEIANQVGLTGVQLHGDETPAALPEFRRQLGARTIIKTLQARELLRERTRVAQFLPDDGSVDAVLIDSGSAAQRGGTGAAFDWEQAAALVSEIGKVKPVIIAGGLNAANVGRALQLFEPWGVDVVSGVESAPGSKSESKMREFVAAVRRNESTTK